MNNAVHLFILALAVFRVCILAVYEDGPFMSVYRFRQLMLNVLPDGLKEVTRCVWCLSVWVSLAMILLYYFLPTAAIWIAAPFSLSALAIIVNELIIEKES